MPNDDAPNLKDLIDYQIAPPRGKNGKSYSIIFIYSK